MTLSDPGASVPRMSNTPTIVTVCGDCLCWIANADDSSLDLLPTAAADAHRAHRAAGIDRLTPNGEVLVPDCCGGDECGGFTTGPCAACGSRGFDGHTVAVLAR